MSSAPTVRELQQRITEMQPVRLGEHVLPTAPEIAPLLPDRALRPGASYAVHGSTMLAMALLAEASCHGSWCGVIGVPHFGAEAAASLGVALDRCVMIPQPGAHDLSIVHSLSEVFTLLLVQPSSKPSAGEVERISARLRDHGAALVVLGDWPRTDAALQVTESSWSGLDTGHGILRIRDLTVQARSRKGLVRRTLRFADGAIVPHLTAPGRFPAPLPLHPNHPEHAGRSNSANHAFAEGATA
ncbi:hypothetical protein [Leucobacter sp. GX24907]